MLNSKEWTALDGRDKGKIFVLTEMPAYQTEMFAFKLLSAMGQSGIDISNHVDGGTAGLIQFAIGSLMKIRFDLVEPLLDEMMGCVKIKMPKMTRGLVEDDIEEVVTRFKLRAEIIKLHTDFFTADDQSTSESKSQAGGGSSPTRIPRKQ